MQEIIDINDNRISYFKNLRYTPLSHTKEKLFVTEGEIVTIKLLKSDFEIISVFVIEEFYKNYHKLISKKKIPDNKLYFADKSLINQIVGFKHHSGIMALASQPLAPELSELKSPVIVMNGIINSENVGSIIRNCAAFGVYSIIVDKQTSSPYLRRAVRVSMGAILDINVYFSDFLVEDLKKLKQNSYKIICAELQTISKPITNFNFPEKFALVFGNEDKGIDGEVLDISDDVIYIPITDRVQSINVASSSAVILSKIFKLNK
ncbi:MAG: RNA methyltransferase [Bacteroidetes bacterium]|nr:MAG: RNA methyltransferase [Bacteroidota bacterium]